MWCGSHFLALSRGGISTDVQSKTTKQHVETFHKVQVVGSVSDSGGDSKKARRLIAREHPHLIILPCYAHQVNLIVGDYFKSNAEILVYSTRADQVIAWLRSKLQVLGLLRDVQTLLRPGCTPLSIIRAVLTRWTSHYLAYRRLLQLRTSVETMLEEDASSVNESQIITGTSAAQDKAREMVACLKDDMFWMAVKRYVSSRHKQRMQA